MPGLLAAIASALLVAPPPSRTAGREGDERIQVALARWLLARRTPGTVFIAMGPDWWDPSPTLVKALRTSGITAAPFSKLRTSRARPLSAQGSVLRLGNVNHATETEVRVGYDIMTTLRVLQGASTATLVLARDGWRVEKTEHVIY
jgi:hypothetical protein